MTDIEQKWHPTGGEMSKDSDAILDKLGTMEAELKKSKLDIVSLEKALKTARHFQALWARKFNAAEAELQALREDKARTTNLLAESISYFDEQFYGVRDGKVFDATRKGFMEEVRQAIDAGRKE